MTTILVADDHEDMRNLLQLRLCSLGFAVETASNGRSAVEMTRRLRPNIILMDLNMPELDGWEASCQLKQDPELCMIPIIALTAYVLPGDQARAKQAGCEACHPKPIDLPLLIEQIHGLVEST